MAVALQEQGRMPQLGNEGWSDYEASCAAQYRTSYPNWQDNGGTVAYGSKSVKGRRPNMEDTDKVLTNFVRMHLLWNDKECVVPPALRHQPALRKITHGADDSGLSSGLLDVPSSSSEDSQEYCSSSGQIHARAATSSFTYAAVFDGHGGPAVSAKLSEEFHILLKNDLELGQFPLQHLAFKIEESFVRMNAKLGECGRNTGSTGVVTLVSRHHIIAANCGDSRGVLWRRNELVRLTRDHKPSHSDEEERILSAGGRVCNYNGVRVMGLLAMTRAFGDHCLSEFGIIAKPEITIIERAQDDEFIILASDGLWDVVSDSEACALTSRCFARAEERSASKDTAARVAANVLIRVALDKGSSDNVTVIVLDLRGSKSQRNQ